MVRDIDRDATATIAALAASPLLIHNYVYVFSLQRYVMIVSFENFIVVYF